MSELYLHAAFAMAGGLGAVLRHMITQLITHELPISTIVVNVAGCFLLGFGLSHYDATGGMSEEERRLIFGFCGGFTTFSSFAYQSLHLKRTRTLVSAAGNIGISFILCWAAFWLGLAL